MSYSTKRNTHYKPICYATDHDTMMSKIPLSIIILIIAHNSYEICTLHDATSSDVINYIVLKALHCT